MVRAAFLGHTPSTGWDFPEAFSEIFLEDPGDARRACPGISLEITAGIAQALQFKAVEVSRSFPEFAPPQYGWEPFFFLEMVQERPSQSRSWNSQQCWGHF